MPDYGVSVTKEVSFRGARQQFSNVYYYNGVTIPVGEATILLAEIVRIERELHGNQIEFVEGRVWSAGGTPAENEMIITEALDGYGNLNNAGYWNPEFAYLIQWPAGTNSLGRPVYLRKWYHSDAPAPGTTITEGQINNTDQLTAAQRQYFADTADQLNPIVLVGYGNYELVAQSNRQTEGGAVCYPWIEHHQLGDEWRAG